MLLVVEFINEDARIGIIYYCPQVQEGRGQHKRVKRDMENIFLRQKLNF